MHFDALLSIPMTRDSASSPIVRRLLLRAATLPGAVEVIATIGTIVAIRLNLKILPLGLLPLLLLYLEGFFGVSGRLFRAYPVSST